jgi:epoxyqueuosine reductase
MSSDNLSELIKAKASDLGFDLCGIAAARPLNEYGEVLEKWCSSGCNGEMDYLNRRIERRINPAEFFPGAKSVAVTGLGYYTGSVFSNNDVPVVSRYAYGENYHDVITRKLNLLLKYIQEIIPGAKGKPFVDHAPILEKAWGREAGLGWPGRHSILINKEFGSFIFLGGIVLDAELGYDEPFNEDLCENCQLCVDACPTGAINDNRTIDVRRCLAYLTIESDGPVPDEIVPKMEGRLFGCDICQEVCPWNKGIPIHHTPEFKISDELLKLTSGKWENMSEEEFAKVFQKSAIGRKKYKPFMNTLSYLRK